MSRGRQLNTLKKEWYWKAKMEALGKAQAEKKARSQDLESKMQSFLEHALQASDPMELAIFAGLMVKYGYLDKHPLAIAFAEAGIDIALIRQKTDVASAAFIAHAGVTELPNLANMIDKATGGTGTVWEDAMKALENLMNFFNQRTQEVRNLP